MSPTLQNALLLVGGIGVLYFGAEWLVRGAARMAASLGLSPIVIGLSVVSVGTSAPELAVCLLAALRGDPDIAVGNVMGSNLANIGLILGLAALSRPLKVTNRVVRREVPLMILVTLFLYPLILDHGLSRLDGVVLLLVLAAYLWIVFRKGDEDAAALIPEYEELAQLTEHDRPRLRLRDIGLIVVGSAGLVIGGSSIVSSAEFIAHEMGISQLFISLSVIAVGTSLPELATSMVAARRDHADIAVGNVIGSNVFNVAAILGTTSVVAPLAVNPAVLTLHLPAVLLISALVLPITWSRAEIKRWEGALFLVAYLAAMIVLFRSGGLV